MTTRRKFISRVSQASVLPLLPLSSAEMFAEAGSESDTIIDAVDVLRLTGTFKSVPGLNKQYQAQPSHVYPDLRPPIYKDNPAAETSGPITQEYLRIKTRGGLEGLYGAFEAESTTAIVKQLKSFLLGKNAMDVEKLWDQMYRTNRHSRAGHYMMAMSMVDNTLWDIRGKRLNAPVYQLLGGATRKEVRAYGSCLGFSIEKGKVGPKAKQLYDQGFLQQKWFMAYGPGDGPAGLKRSIELVEELRNALGDDAQIMFDAFMSWDLPFATAWCTAVEKYRPYWLEEAFPADRIEAFIQLKKNTTIPLATGEHVYNRWEAQNFLKEGTIQIIQADPEWCGGVSELVKICHLASVYGAKVFPHGHNIHAALHVVASQSPDVCPLLEYLIVHVPHKLHFQKNPLLTSNAVIQLPTKAGFGIELDGAMIEKQEIIS